MLLDLHLFHEYRKSNKLKSYRDSILLAMYLSTEFLSVYSILVNELVFAVYICLFYIGIQ